MPRLLELPDPVTVLAWPVDGGELSGLVVRGPRTVARYYGDGPGPRCAMLRLPPGTLRGLGGLADREVPFTEVAAGRGRLVREAAGLLGDGVRVGAVARRLHLSERHLRGLFADALGLAPRQFQRLHRVRRVLARPDVALPQVALLAGYYDQSHMTGEFREVMRTTPAAFRAGQWPEPSACHSGPL